MTSTLQDAPRAPAPCHLIERQQLTLRVRELPALPKAAMDALDALRDDDTSSDHCGELIGRDQALAARTLRLANSAFYGVAGRVGSVRDAVNLLGRRPLGSMITLATVAQQFKADNCPLFSFGSFWRHAIAVALCSRGVARELGHDGEQAFTLGLLHDIGRVALAAHLRASSRPPRAPTHRPMGTANAPRFAPTSTTTGWATPASRACARRRVRASHT